MKEYANSIFNELKNVLPTNPDLQLYKQGCILQLHTYASSQGFGTVLLQKEDDEKFHSLEYNIKKTSLQQKRYSSYELLCQVLAIIEALKKFGNY